jgi:hypothetical protein
MLKIWIPPVAAASVTAATLSSLNAWAQGQAESPTSVGTARI